MVDRLRFEYKTEDSKKFWEPQAEESTLTVRFGKIGTDGQTHTKKFSSPAEAPAEYRKLVCEKLAKGYKPTQEAIFTILQDASSVAAPAAIDSLYIGEHVPNKVVQDICGWATACIQNGMTPKQFENIWNKFIDEEDEDLAEALGRTGEDFWSDVTEWGEGELYELYAKAVENGGDRFIWFDNNAYIDIVALRGDPGARAIEICVLGEENCKDKENRWLNDWPNELGPGATIASLSPNGYATLRNGKKISTEKNS